MIASPGTAPPAGAFTFVSTACSTANQAIPEAKSVRLRVDLATQLSQEVTRCAILRAERVYEVELQRSVSLASTWTKCAHSSLDAIAIVWLGGRVASLVSEMIEITPQLSLRQNHTCTV